VLNAQNSEKCRRWRAKGPPAVMFADSAGATPDGGQGIIHQTPTLVGHIQATATAPGRNSRDPGLSRGISMTLKKKGFGKSRRLCCVWRMGACLRLCRVREADGAVATFLRRTSRTMSGAGLWARKFLARSFPWFEVLLGLTIVTGVLAESLHGDDGAIAVVFSWA